MVLDENTWNSYTPQQRQFARQNWDWSSILGNTANPATPAYAYGTASKPKMNMSSPPAYAYGTDEIQNLANTFDTPDGGFDQAGFNAAIQAGNANRLAAPPATSPTAAPAPAPVTYGAITMDKNGVISQNGKTLGDGSLSAGYQQLANQSGQPVNSDKRVFTPIAATPPTTPPVVKPRGTTPGGTTPGDTTPGGQTPGTQGTFNPQVSNVTTAQALTMFLDDHPQDVWNAAVNNLKSRGVAPYMTNWLRQNYPMFHGAWQGMLAQQAIKGVMPTGTFADYLFGVTQSDEVQNSIYMRGLAEYMADPRTTQVTRQRDYLNSGAAQG